MNPVLKEIVDREARNVSFWKMLNHFIPQSGFSESGEKTSILSLGCGIAEEMRVVTSFFSSKVYLFPTTKAHYIGVDIDADKLRLAHEIVRTPAVADPSEDFVVVPSFELHCADASQLREVPGLSNPMDVILLRHQYLASDLIYEKNNWYYILEEALGRLLPRGILLISSFKEAESRLLMEVLATLNCEVILNEPNPYSIPLGPKHPGVAYDKIVTIVRKKA